MGRLQGYELLVILMVLIPGFLADHQLPAPENISIVSINLKHFLQWDPVMVAGNLSYSVESQGEYEKRYTTGYWHPIENCQEISAYQCNVTEEVFASVSYSFRVQAKLGNQISAWAELDPPFNRKTTLLIPPKVELQVDKQNLLVYIEDYGPDFQFFIFYWQTEKKDEMKCKKTNNYNTYTFLEQAEAGKEYCADVIAHARPISKNSSRSEPVCVQVKDGERSGVFIALLSVFVVILVFVPMVLAVWKSATTMHYFCCPDEDIPDVLKEPYTDRRMLKHHYSSKNNTEEIDSVELHELMLQENSDITVKIQRL
ncbi:interleukin-20 receptor subunit beta [Leptodactylus fuscus]|uniref:interleukin-20 receptor subunit beta n=1 Tax=Leptodactylus fuscus TaxID=238119 RepID=UPI003F4E49CB